MGVKMLKRKTIDSYVEKMKILYLICEDYKQATNQADKNKAIHQFNTSVKGLYGYESVFNNKIDYYIDVFLSLTIYEISKFVRSSIIKNYTTEQKFVIKLYEKLFLNRKNEYKKFNNLIGTTHGMPLDSNNAIEYFLEYYAI